MFPSRFRPLRRGFVGLLAACAITIAGAGCQNDKEFKTSASRPSGTWHSAVSAQPVHGGPPTLFLQPQAGAKPVTLTTERNTKACSTCATLAGEYFRHGGLPSRCTACDARLDALVARD
jgi:hypothetical protein